MDFEDIKIVDLETKVEPSGSGSAMRRVFLRLSGEPPQLWAELFDREREFPRHTMWREAHVSGNHIVVDCVPEEIEKYHLSDLKQDVANANMKFRSWSKIAADRKRALDEAKAKEEERTKDLRKRLDFS